LCFFCKPSKFHQKYHPILNAATLPALLPGPLYRVTHLARDPAAGWLSSTGRFRVFLSWAAVWVAYVVVVRAAWFTGTVVMETPALSGFNVSVLGFTFPRFAAMAVSAGLLFPTRHLARIVRASATANMAKREASRVARPIDDHQVVASEPPGRVVSVVGWIRGHGYLLHRAAGHEAVGLALPCWHQTVVETLHNFDLVDERNRPLLVIAAGARLLGRPNVYLSRRDDEERAFVTALNLGVDVNPTNWRALLLRDGDPVMVIGVKTAVDDTSEPGRPVTRPAIASTPARPLLVIALAAERRQV
jgi:hypothetical protein